MVASKAYEVLRDIERMAQRRYLPIIGRERGQVLVDVVRAFKPQRILEVGTLLGYSTVLMGKELDADAEIVTIEVDSDEAQKAEENIRNAQIKPRVTVLAGDALEIIPTLKGEFDLVFLDAAKHEYYEYLRSIEDKLHKGSVVVADNAGAYAHSMRDYLHHVRKSGQYRSQFIRVGGDGMEVSVKS